MKIITHFCSSEGQRKISELCDSLAAKLPFEIECVQNLNAAGNSVFEDSCLFFVSVNENTVDDLRNLLNRKIPAKRQVVIISNKEYNYFNLAFEYEICNIIHISNLTEQIFCGILQMFSLDNAAPAPSAPESPAPAVSAALDAFFNEKVEYDIRRVLSGTVKTKNLVKNAFADVIDKMPENLHCAFMINCHELISNALAYGVKGITPAERDAWASQLEASTEIPQGKEVQVRVIIDGDRYGISVLDFGGALTKSRILEKIRRHSVVAGETVQIGIEDLAGRGLIILSSQGLLLFRLKQGVSTEVSLIASASNLSGEQQFSILTLEN